MPIASIFIMSLIVIHLLASFFLIVFVLLHSGKGSGLSDFLGGGGAGLSGGTSIERNLDRITIATAVIFGFTTFWLAWKWT